MDVRLKPFNFAEAAQRAGLGQVAERVAERVRASQAGGAAVGAAEAGGFGSSFKAALQQVSAAQEASSGLQRELQLGNPTVSLEQTMVAMQKAQLGFQAALQVRNRLVQAYTDVMNLQV